MACSEIDIVNPALWELLKEHLSWYPYHIFRGSPVTLNSPFEPLVHEWDALKKAAEQTPKDDTNKQAREDLDLLLKTISGGSSGDAKLDRYFKQRDVTREQKTVQFDNLWTIFPPGTLVYGRPFQNEPQLFLVEDCRTPWPDTDGRQQAAWRLTCWTYDWNGDLFQRTPFTLTFEPYEGHRPITSLPFYPFEYHSDISGITATLVERGKKFRMLCSAKEAPQMFEYNGDSMFVKRGFFGSQIDDVSKHV